MLAEDTRERRDWLARAMAGSLTPPERAALQEAAGAMMKLARFEERPAAQARPEDG